SRFVDSTKSRQGHTRSQKQNRVDVAKKEIGSQGGTYVCRNTLKPMRLCYDIRHDGHSLLNRSDTNVAGSSACSSWSGSKLRRTRLCRVFSRLKRETTRVRPQGSMIRNLNE